MNARAPPRGRVAARTIREREVDRCLSLSLSLSLSSRKEGALLFRDSGRREAEWFRSAAWLFVSCDCSCGIWRGLSPGAMVECARFLVEVRTTHDGFLICFEIRGGSMESRGWLCNRFENGVFRRTAGAL